MKTCVINLAQLLVKDLLSYQGFSASRLLVMVDGISLENMGKSSFHLSEMVRKWLSEIYLDKVLSTPRQLGTIFSRADMRLSSCGFSIETFGVIAVWIKVEEKSKKVVEISSAGATNFDYRIHTFWTWRLIIFLTGHLLVNTQAWRCRPCFNERYISKDFLHTTIWLL